MKTDTEIDSRCAEEAREERGTGGMNADQNGVSDAGDQASWEQQPESDITSIRDSGSNKVDESRPC